MRFVILLFAGWLQANDADFADTTRYVPWIYDQEYSGAIGANESNVVKLAFHQNISSAVVRVTVKSPHATLEAPILVVVRESRNVLSWQVPLTLENKFQYSVASRTLCPDFEETFELKDSVPRPLYIELSTNSAKLLGFSVIARITNHFHLRLNEPLNLTSSPPQPQFLLFNFPEDVETAVVRVTSDNAEDCMIVSAQPIQCPVFDLDTNVKFLGMYQTMTSKAALTLRKQDVDKVHIVFVVKANPYECTRMSRLVPPYPLSDENQTKLFTVVVEKATNTSDHLNVVLITLSIFLAMYVVVFISWLIFYCRDARRFDTVRKELMDGLDTPADTITEPIDNCVAVEGISSRQAIIDDAATDSEDFDSLPEVATEKVIVRSKAKLVVADLARKPYKLINKKYSIYPWNLGTISILYVLPVVQLVWTYQSELLNSGNQDMCFYNFECLHTMWGILAFNSVFSNVGYFLLGVLFLLLVWMRDAQNQRILMKNPAFHKRYGIPNHFGLFYAMGVALILEGILSACYHICPNFSNFQFDTAYMYMIGALSMLKIYQIRHPDINANSHVSYFVMALIIALSVVGEVYRGLPFWIVFTVFYAVLIVLLTAEFYYKGQWKIERSNIIRILRELFCLRKSCHWFRPRHPDRMCFLMIGNALNWGFLVYGIMKEPENFPLFLVIIFINNLMLYLFFYVAMKLRHGEHLNWRVIVTGVLSCISWGFSLYFFLHQQSSWHITAAQSRELNSGCILSNFYDAHDVWHFLSALSLFLSFSILLVIDDDLSHTAYDQIPVF